MSTLQMGRPRQVRPHRGLNTRQNLYLSQERSQRGMGNRAQERGAGSGLESLLAVQGDLLGCGNGDWAMVGGQASQKQSLDSDLGYPEARASPQEEMSSRVETDSSGTPLMAESHEPAGWTQAFLLHSNCETGYV